MVSLSQIGSILIPHLHSTLRAKAISLLSSSMENTLSLESITSVFHIYIHRCAHKTSFNMKTRISLLFNKNRNNKRPSNLTSNSSQALLISIFRAALQFKIKALILKKVGKGQQAQPKLLANLSRQSDSQKSKLVVVGRMLCKQRRMHLEMRSLVKLRSLISFKQIKTQVLRLPCHRSGKWLILLTINKVGM